MQLCRLLCEITGKLRAGARPIATGAMGDLIKAGQELNAVMDVINAAESPKPHLNRASQKALGRFAGFFDIVVHRPNAVAGFDGLLAHSPCEARWKLLSRRKWSPQSRSRKPCYLIEIDLQ
ncbi:Hypothetical protein Cp262_2092 [Corynebacterium pseudotuberculosis]|nr:Hypothetical protein Cp262_2092 [Corynebacterium pseudotuberculosis]